MNTTTDLKELEQDKIEFAWGEFIKIHRIGEYALVEYYPHEFKNCCSTGKIDYSKIRYSCYINENDICHSRDSIDSALAQCIAYKHDGCNTQAADFFMRMIKAENK